MALFEQGILIVQNGLGYEELPVSTSAVGFADIPVGNSVRRALIQVNDGDIRWIAAPNDVPTASRGIKLVAGDFFVYDGSTEAISFIQDADSE